MPGSSEGAAGTRSTWTTWTRRVAVAGALAACAYGACRRPWSPLPKPERVYWEPLAKGRICAVLAEDGAWYAIGADWIGNGTPWVHRTSSVVDARNGHARRGWDLERMKRIRCDVSYEGGRAPIVMVEDDVLYQWQDVSAFGAPGDLDALSAEKVGGRVGEVISAECVFLHADRWYVLPRAAGGKCPPQPSADQVARAGAATAARSTPGQVLDSGVTYSVADSSASPPRVAVTATRAGAVLWTKHLAAKSLPALPIAVAGGVVMVGAAGAGGGLALRGLDAATGQERYQHLLRADNVKEGAIAAAGAMFLAWSDRLVGIEAAAGRIAWATRDHTL